MKPYQKKLMFSAVLLVLGICLLVNAFDLCHPLTDYVGNWAVIPFVLTLLLSAAIMWGGWLLLRQVFGDEKTLELFKEKLYDSCFPVMKLVDRFQEWLDSDGSKK